MGHYMAIRVFFFFLRYYKITGVTSVMRERDAARPDYIYRKCVLVGLWPQNYKKIESKNYKSRVNAYRITRQAPELL